MADLADERDFLLASLRDLDAEHDAGDLDDDDYRELKDGYTARAAAVLRAIDGEAESPPAEDGPSAGAEPADPTADRPAPRGSPPSTRRRARVIIAGAIAGAGIVGGVLLARNAGTRLPGANVSGDSVATEAPIGPTATLDAQAQAQVQQNDILGAIKTFDQALKIDPKDLEALAYKGWLLRIAGSQAHDNQLIDAGLASIRQAEAVDPAYPDAHFFAGETLLRDKNDPAGAIKEFQEFLASNPPQSLVPEVQLELQSAQTALAQQTATTTTAP